MVDIDALYKDWVRIHGEERIVLKYPSLRGLHDWFLKKCEERGIDPEVIDFAVIIDPTLMLRENKAILLAEMDKAIPGAAYERQAEVARAWAERVAEEAGILEQYTERLAKLEIEAARGKERLKRVRRLQREIAELKERPERWLVPEVSEHYLGDIQEIFMRIPGATVEGWRAWVAAFAKRLTEDWRKVVASAWEPEMRAFIEKRPPPPVAWLPPPPPKVERPPRVPRAPPVPRLVEFVCPKCARPLEPITEISWSERVPIMEKPDPWMPEVFTGQYEEKWYTRKIPEAELVFMCMAGMGGELKGLMKELAISVSAKDREALIRMIIELEGRMKADCPYGGMYFKVRRGRMIGPVAKSEVLRQILAPPPAPRVPRVAEPLRILREAHEYERGIEVDPAFKKYVEEEVGLTWDAYLRQDPWTKQAIRQEFIKRVTKLR